MCTFPPDGMFAEVGSKALRILQLARLLIVFWCGGAGATSTFSPRVLLLYGEPPGYNFYADVKQKLVATGNFAIVDAFDARQNTPTLAGLQAYDVVLIFSDWAPQYSIQSAMVLGDTLANYFDGGGAVIVMSMANSGSIIQGRFGTAINGYVLIDGTAAWDAPRGELGSVFERNSPLLANVAAFKAGAAWRSRGSVSNGGIVVASWDDGVPLIIRGAKACRRIVTLNFYPVSKSVRDDYWQGDGTVILKNAILYSAPGESVLGARWAGASISCWAKVYGFVHLVESLCAYFAEAIAVVVSYAIVLPCDSLLARDS